jgi:hypothetical protein
MSDDRRDLVILTIIGHAITWRWAYITAAVVAATLWRFS